MLPGGMKARRFHQHLRENGINMSLDEAAKLREKWFECYPEMTKFIDRQKITSKPKKIPEGHDYKAVTITGFIRNYATYNASLNTRFQQPVAHLAKKALWTLENYVLPNGDRLGNRLLNFVHES